MARILICHVPKDGSIARDLGAALMGRGHYVSFDGEPDAPRLERSVRLRQFEAVIVLWTETSSPSPGLAAIAGEALPLNVLVPVKANSVEKTRLPLAFRKLNMYSPTDTDGIARMVSRLSTAAASLRDMAEIDAARRYSDVRAPAAPEMRAPPRPSAPAAPPAKSETARPVIEQGEAVRARPLTGLPEVTAPAFATLSAEPAASAPAPASDSPAPVRREHVRPSVRVITAEDLADAVDAGLIVYHIPEAMWLGAPTTVELTLGRDVLSGLIDSYGGRDGGVRDVRQSLETLSISLYGAADAFEIERQSERTQFVAPRQALAGRDPASFGRWLWLVTPRSAGPQELVVRISALLRDGRGVPAPVALPDRRFEVAIEVPEGESLISALAGWYRR